MATIVISENAAGRLKKILERDAATEAEARLRVFVDHECHCGGKKYGMAIGEAVGDGDEVLSVSGVPMLIAPEVVAQPGTAAVDFAESKLGSGFTLTNSEHSCGGMHRA